MSMQHLHADLLQLLLSGKENQKTIIKRLDELIVNFGIIKIKSWRNLSNRTQNTLLHELVEMELTDVVLYLLKTYKLNINIRRESDGTTPFQLANQNQNHEMCNLLKTLGADSVQLEDVNQYSRGKDHGNKMNIVWLDLEMTSLEDPQILECAVIITNKNLDELERGNWVIHFEQSELETLGDWHQNTFKKREDGGNGLFSDSIGSRFTKEQVENELLDLIQRHCPEKTCPLAGSSIHIDKEVLKRWMPKVHDYLHYRIIDVSSFQAIMKRWTPWIDSGIKKQLSTDGQNEVIHRAMDDIEWSMAYMKMFRSHLGKPRDRKNDPPVSYHNRSASVSMVPRNVASSRNNPDIDRRQLHSDEKQLVERLQIEQTFDVKTLRLTQRDQQIYNQNPHLREVFKNNQRLQMNKMDFTSSNRLLISSNNQSYKNKFDSTKLSTTEHCEERKLLLTEIEFLTNYAINDTYLVVYAGAAPGLHINCLSSLFPRLEFVLIDTKTFSARETDNISIRQENFTTDLARRYSESKHPILFICNAHTYDANDNALDDMKTWRQLMKPSASLLSFRLPRTSEKFNYFEGDLLIEPWASKRAIEYRLVVDEYPKIVEYNKLVLEEAMIYFQNVTRIMYYKHNMNDIDTEGLDHCYDCTAEIFILQQYFKKIIKIDNELNLKKQTSKLSSDISRLINHKDKP